MAAPVAAQKTGKAFPAVVDAGPPNMKDHGREKAAVATEGRQGIPNSGGSWGNSWMRG
jgi:hypothetical protein